MILKRIVVCAVGMLCMHVALFAKEDFGHPKSYLGYADSDGKLTFWLDVAPISLGDGSQIPFRLNFTTEQPGGTQPMGAYWKCPLIQSVVVPIDERVVEFITIGGRKVYLLSNLNREGEFLSADRAFEGKSGAAGGFTVSGRGWRYKFQNGILKSAKNDNGIELDWVYNGGRFHAIVERGKGEVLSFKYIANRELPISFSLNQKSYSIVSKTVPIVREVMGQKLLSGYAPTVSEISRGGEIHAYNITLKDTDTFSLDYQAATRAPRSFTWRSDDGTLLTSDEWSYELVKDEEKPPMMKRVNKKGRMESYWYDARTGRSEYRDLLGAVTVRNYFIGNGPARHRIRSMRQTLKGKEVFNMKWAYNEAGELIRRTSGDIEWNMERHANGEISRVIKARAGKEIERRSYDKMGRMIEKVKGEISYEYIREGGKTIVKQLENGIPVSAFVPSDDFVGSSFVIKDNKVVGSRFIEDAELPVEFNDAKDLLEKVLRAGAGSTK